MNLCSSDGGGRVQYWCGLEWNRDVGVCSKFSYG